MTEIRALTTDAVIVSGGEVVLLERDHPPAEGTWVLPGGFVERGETAREACIREVVEEIGLDVTIESCLGIYDDPDRDERGNVSVAYRCVPIDDKRPTAREEARRVGTFDPGNLPEMGFDHSRIIRDALID